VTFQKIEGEGVSMCIPYRFRYYCCASVRFMPTQLASGHLLLTHEVFSPGDRHNRVSIARLSRWPMGILGIAQAASSAQLATVGANFKAQLEELMPPDSLLPLAKNCLAFQQEDSRFTLNTKDAFSGLVVIPHEMGNKQLYLSTLVAELCSTILAGFSDIVSGSLALL
jgi:trafficking protein particle complex subunit 9